MSHFKSYTFIDEQVSHHDSVNHFNLYAQAVKSECLFWLWKCISPHNLTPGGVISSYMDRAADRGMLILIWQLSPSQSFLAHSAMRHNGVCMVISCAHLNRILDSGMLSLRQHYSITIPTGDGRLTTENTQIGYGKRVQTVCLPFLSAFQRVKD